MILRVHGFTKSCERREKNFLNWLARKEEVSLTNLIWTRKNKAGSNIFQLLMLLRTVKKPDLSLISQMET